MELPAFNWTFESVPYDSYLFLLDDVVPKNDAFFDPKVFFELVFAKETDTDLNRLIECDATKGIQQLRKNILDIRKA